METQEEEDRSEVDQLLDSLTDDEAEAASGAGPTRNRREGDREPAQLVLMGAALALIAVALGAVGVLAIQSITDDEPDPDGAQVETGAASTAPVGTATAGTVGDDSTTADSTTDSTAASSPSSTVATLEEVPATADNPEGAIRYVVLEGGQAYVRGLAPDQQTVNNLVATVASWSGTPVLDETEIDVAAPSETSVRVYVRDIVEFGSGETDIPAEELTEVDRVAQLLAANPSLAVQLSSWVEGGRDLNESDVEHRYVIARAAAVEAQLLAGGVEQGQVTTVIGDEDDLDELPDYDPDRAIILDMSGTFPG